jgi:glyoxylase-like metal-dependent hydrolase (beta-lactamase superfamily II)
MSNTIQRADFGPVTVFFGDKGGKYPDGNQVVVRGSDSLAVFDTPQVSNLIGSAFDAADLAILGHVHEDHMAGLHRIPRAAVHVHERDVEAARSWDGLARHYGYSDAVLSGMKVKIAKEFCYVPRPDAIAYRDGAVWDLGGVRVRALHMPGHTSGHCVLLVEPHGIAFIGDIDLSSFGPYYGDATSNLGQFRTTLERVVDVPANTWITSHHKGVYTERGAFLDALGVFCARVGEREQRVLDLIGEQPRSLAELVACRVVYKPEATDAWVDDAERRSIEQHLEELVARERIVLRDDGRYRRAA